MTEALGNEVVDLDYTLPAKGLAGAIARHEQRASEHVVFPRPRGDFDDCDCTTPPPIVEPTGQYAVVVDAAQVPYVRLGHRWYRAGNPTVTATPWPLVRAVAVVSGGQS